MTGKCHIRQYRQVNCLNNHITLIFQFCPLKQSYFVAYMIVLYSEKLLENKMSNQINFLPFHAINEFMRPDFKLSVIRDVLTNITTLPTEQASDLANITRRMVKIPGFRNSEKAPPWSR